MTEPTDLETFRIVRDLRKMGAAEHERDQKIISFFWSRWGLEKNDTTYAAYKMAAPFFDDFLHYGKPLISETLLFPSVFSAVAV